MVKYVFSPLHLCHESPTFHLFSYPRKQFLSASDFELEDVFNFSLAAPAWLNGSHGAVGTIMYIFTNIVVFFQECPIST